MSGTIQIEEQKMSDAFDAKMDDARANVEELAKKMREWGTLNLMACIEAAYNAIQNEVVEHEIRVPSEGEVKCPACGQEITTIIEIERESQTEAIAEFNVSKSMISDAGEPKFTDIVAWITPCCAERVALSDEWIFTTY